MRNISASLSIKLLRMNLKKIKKNIVPDIQKDLQFDLKHYPDKFLKCMLYMNSYLEDHKLKMFQPISLRTDVKDKYITINTNGLIDILFDLTDKKNYFDNIRKYQKDLWNMVFNLQKIKKKGYSFNYQISTDGYGVSISMINNNDIQKKHDNINKRNKARYKMKSIYQDLDDTEKEKEIQKRKTEYIKRSSELKDKAKKDIKTRQQQIKKLSKDEQEKIKLHEKLKRNES